jgi:hypothetical protein
MVKLASAIRPIDSQTRYQHPPAQQPSTWTAMSYVDPLDDDRPTDATITLTHRQLLRLVFVAAETGARFQREGINVDPVDWLFARRRLFNDQIALDACQKRDAFVRVLVLHGLSLGLDASPNDIDELRADDAFGTEPAAEQLSAMTPSKVLALEFDLT